MSDARLENDGIIGENFLFKVETRIVQASENNRKPVGYAELVTMPLSKIQWNLTGLCHVQEFITKKYKSCVQHAGWAKSLPRMWNGETRYDKANGKSYTSALDGETTALPLTKEPLTRKLGMPHNLSWCFRDEKNLWTLLVIKPKIHCMDCSLVTKRTLLPQLLR